MDSRRCRFRHCRGTDKGDGSRASALAPVYRARILRSNAAAETCRLPGRAWSVAGGSGIESLPGFRTSHLWLDRMGPIPSDAGADPHQIFRAGDVAAPAVSVL